MLYTYHLMILFLLIEQKTSFELNLALSITSDEVTFKITEEVINFAFTENKLQNFIISSDILKVCELLGAGEM